MRGYVHSSAASSYREGEVRRGDHGVHKGWIKHGSRYPSDFEASNLYDIKDAIWEYHDRKNSIDDDDYDDCCSPE